MTTGGTGWVAGEVGGGSETPDAIMEERVGYEATTLGGGGGGRMKEEAF